jgi:hypothetical protein
MTEIRIGSVTSKGLFKQVEREQSIHAKIPWMPHNAFNTFYGMLLRLI